MYNEYFGLRQAPFRITPDTALFYTGGNRGDVLDALVYAITSGEGIVKVVGEVGTGKTMLCRMLEERLPDNVQIAYLANPSLTPQDILHAVALELELDVASDANRLQVMHRLQEVLLARHADNQRVVVLVEEAQSMPVDTLEEIRLLSNLETKNEKLLQIVLFGQPELDANLAKAEIRQLRERITHSFALTPLGREEVRDYVAFRLRASGYRGRDAFTPDAYRTMSQASQGLTRRVNIIADKAMLAAFADDTHDVSARHVKSAIADSEFHSTRTYARRLPQFAMLGVAVVVAGAIGWYAGSKGSRIEAPMNSQSPAPLATQPMDSTQPAETAAASAPQQRPISPVVTVAPFRQRPAVAQQEGPGQQQEGTQEQERGALPGVAAVASTSAIERALVLPSSTQVLPASILASSAVTSMSESAATQPPIADTNGASSLPSMRDDSPLTTSNGAVPVAAAATTPVQAPEASPVRIVAPPEQNDAGSPSSAQSKPERMGLVAEPAHSSAASGTASEPAPAASGKPEHETLLQWRLAHTVQWLRGDAKNHYSIQLLATNAAQRRNLEAFLLRRERAGNIDRIFVYTTQINDQQWYGVLFGEFTSFTRAQEALQALPSELRRHRPFIRNVRDIKAFG